mgnify:CR=1 FL=1
MLQTVAPWADQSAQTALVQAVAVLSGRVAIDEARLLDAERALEAVVASAAAADGDAVFDAARSSKRNTNRGLARMPSIAVRTPTSKPPSAAPFW